MAMKARYTVANGEIIAQKRDGVRSLFVPDPLSSTVALIDNTPAKTDTWLYQPYLRHEVARLIVTRRPSPA